MSYLINTNVPVGSALNRLGSLIDVEINNPLGKDVLSYDSATQTWVNDDSIGNIVSMTQAQYDQLSTAEKQDPKKYYYITDTTISGAPIDDNAVSTSKTWSSDKINSNLTVHTDTVDGVVFSRQGNIVSIFGYGISPASLPTIPEIYRPDDTMIFPVTSIASSKLYNAYMGITSAGAMNCNYSSTYGGSPTALTGGSIYFTVSYAV